MVTSIKGKGPREEKKGALSHQLRRERKGTFVARAGGGTEVNGKDAIRFNQT